MRFAGYDGNGDGVAEIVTLVPRSAAGGAGERVLVLVEGRLLEPLDGAPPLGPPLERLVADLGDEGYRAALVEVALGASDRHQDGQYVLALRDFLRVVAAESKLAGVLLVGRFPDAYVVRTCNWRKREDISLNGKAYRDAPFLRRVPEEVALRADIVLSDLDGRWEDVYVQPRTRLETIHAVYADRIPPTGGPCVDLARGTVTFEDFFHVSDGKLEVSERLDDAGVPCGWSVTLHDATGDHECSEADRAAGNVMARPDILVSRIDAKGCALRPRPDILGVDGGGLLDEAGQPREVRFAAPDQVPDWRNGIWEADPVLERRLLAEYMDRNHAYRTGTAAVAWRPSSMACGLGSGFGVVSAAAKDWDAADRGEADVHGSPTLAQVVGWLRYPAVLRTLRAHSDATGSVFRGGDLDELHACRGGAPWSWPPRGDRLAPSLAAATDGGRLDWFLLRSLWENGTVAPGPAFYHHTGCNGISPPGAGELPFDHPSYGRRQGAEALLFFARGLALVGRAKVFYDEPRGFAEALAEGRTFGAAWARYFEIESEAGSWGSVGGDIGRKRAYFWTVLGDWSLRLSRPH